MNRRIVVIDSAEVPNYLRITCKMPDCEFAIYDFYPNRTKSALGIPIAVPDELLNLESGDGIMIVGSRPFSALRQRYHYGIRSENYADCQMLRRLSIEGGAFAKCVTEDVSNDEVRDFLDPHFTDHRDFSWFKHVVIHDLEKAINALNYFDSLPEDTNYGFDYEASGMPLDEWFEISGAAICTKSYGAFISFTDIRHTSTPEQYQTLLDRLRDFLYKRMSKIWTYNMQYEFQVSHRMLGGVDLYNLCDASVFNVLDGHHLKKYSLKWTANMILQSTVWDTEFDYISDLIENMLFTVEGKLKKDKVKVLKVDRDNFKNTEEWKMLCNRYPDYVDEFERLILEYWGNAFMCIPSDILGYYCNLDAFYTLMIYEERKSEYSEDAIQTFLDNIRLGARLHSCGLYINEDFRVKYKVESEKLMAWGITYCATARCKIRMAQHKPKMADIKKYPVISQKLLKEGNFFEGRAEDIVKYLLSSNLDTLDTNPYGLNDGSLAIKYGQDFAADFMDMFVKAMKGAKLIKEKVDRKTKAVKIDITKIDETVVRKKKLIEVLVADSFIKYTGLDKIRQYDDGSKNFGKDWVKVDEVVYIYKPHLELERYLFYEKAYNELTKISKNQLNDINSIPDSIYAFGTKFSCLDYSSYISDNYFKCKSPEENNLICQEFISLSPSESAYLAAILESTQQLNGAENFYKNLGINTVEEGFSHFIDEVTKRQNIALINPSYPNKMFELFETYYSEAKSGNPTDNLKEVWANFNGFIAQEQFFKYVSDQYVDYGKPFIEDDLNNNFFFMRKFVVNYLLYKKYSKVLSTYIDGMFKANNRFVIEGEDRIPIRYANPNEPGAVEKCFVHYEVNTKSSKRWSSGFHTIISHADLKDCICVPPSYDQNGNIIYGGSFNILTYFDISSAEVKAAGFASGDPDLIAKFNAGEDIYIYSAKLYLGDKFDQLDGKAKKMWRKRFKTIFLGVLYGLGKKSLAERLNASEKEAEEIIQGLYTSFPQLRVYVNAQQQYPLYHGGYINTMLGDKLKVVEYNYYTKAKTIFEKANLEARIQRLGVNLPIQGGTSSIMSRGFFNNIRESIKQGWNNPLQPIITVH